MNIIATGKQDTKEIVRITHGKFLSLVNGAIAEVKAGRFNEFP